MMVISTHANTAIDVFSRCEDAQILHVTHDGKRSDVTALQAAGLGGVLDDLGFLASDLLQSNFVVWVEGPSDRILIRRGLHDIAPELEVGIHYSIMFYGGRLLSHLGYDVDPDDELVREFINLARINRNSAIIMDSDHDAADHGDLNVTKQRVISEFEEAGCMTWVTWGREIENYVPLPAYLAAVSVVHKDAPAFHDGEFADRVTLSVEDGRRRYIDKVRVARAICLEEKVTFEGDWDERLAELARRIRAANGMPER